MPPSIVALRHCLVTFAGQRPGLVKMEPLRDGMRELDYDGWIVIESFGFAIKEIAAAACIWRDLARTPEDIAFEGLKFLKDLVRSE